MIPSKHNRDAAFDDPCWCDQCIIEEYEALGLKSPERERAEWLLAQMKGEGPRIWGLTQLLRQVLGEEPMPEGWDQ